MPGQFIIARHKRRLVGFRQRIGGFRRRHHGLHGQAVKAQVIGHVDHVFGKVRIKMRVGAPHVIPLVLIGLVNKGPVTGDHPVIGGAAAHKGPHVVMDLLPSV